MGWDCDWGITGSCTYQYNYSHENAGGFYLECLTCFGPAQTDTPELVVRYNVSQGEGIVNAGSGGNANVKLEMYNNTLYNPGGAFDIRLAANSVVANNIFVGSSLTRFDTDRGITVDRNVYHGFAGPAADVNAINADPLFANPGTGRDGLDTVDGYKLTAGSPAIAAGRIISGNGAATTGAMRCRGRSPRTSAPTTVRSWPRRSSGSTAGCSNGRSIGRTNTLRRWEPKRWPGQQTERKHQ